MNLAFLVAPIRGAGGFWSLGEAYSETDMYTQNYSAEEWLNVLEQAGGTHVYLHYIDAEFIERYTEAFESETQIEQGGMYSLAIQGDKKYLKKVILEDN